MSEDTTNQTPADAPQPESTTTVYPAWDAQHQPEAFRIYGVPPVAEVTPEPDTRSRDERLADLVEKGDPLALMLQDAGAWRISNHSNFDGSWQVREFVWPSGEAAKTAIKALGLEE